MVECSQLNKGSEMLSLITGRVAEEGTNVATSNTILGMQTCHAVNDRTDLLSRSFYRIFAISASIVMFRHWDDAVLFSSGV